MRWLLEFSAFVAAFLAVLSLPGIVVLLCIEAECRGRSGHAPQSDFETRRDWGEKLYRPYLEHIDGWAARSPLVRSDVGDVQRIAPIGTGCTNNGQPWPTQDQFPHATIIALTTGFTALHTDNQSTILEGPPIELCIFNSDQVNSYNDALRHYRSAAAQPTVNPIPRTPHRPPADPPDGGDGSLVWGLALGVVAGLS